MKWLYGRRRSADADDFVGELLGREVAELEAEARTTGIVRADRLEAAERLARIRALQTSLRSPPPPARLYPLAAFLLTLLLASILIFTHVRQTPVELRIKAAGLNFIPAASQTLEHLDVGEVEVTPVRSIEGPYAPPWAPTDSSRVRLARDTAANARGAITLEPLSLPKSARVLLRRESGTLFLALRSSNPRDVELQISMAGGLTRQDAQGTTEPFVVPRTDQVRLVSSSDKLDLRFATDSARLLGALELPIRDLEMVSLHSLGEGHGARSVSTVLSGSIYFVSLNGDEIRLRRGQLVRFDAIWGSVSELRVVPDGIELAFTGQVRGMRTGSGDAERTLMPTRLEWIRANRRLALLWGSALYAFGILLTLHRWWRRE